LLPFDLHQLRRLVRDVLGGDFKLLDQLPGRARVAEAVLHANGARNDRAAVKFWASRDDAADAPCQRADLMFFGGNHDPARMMAASSTGFMVCRLMTRVS